MVKQDDQYWGKREKNKSAALRSHEERRLRENQIAQRLAHLERENGNMKQRKIKTLKWMVSSFIA